MPEHATKSDLPATVSDRTCHAWSLDNPLRRLLAPAAAELDRLGLRSGDVVADLGTGVGYFSGEILRRVGSRGFLWAVDIDQENLEAARARIAPAAPVRWLTGSASDLVEIPSDSVDRVLLYLVLCCLGEKAQTMRETWRILRPGGRVLVTYPRRRKTRRSARRHPLRMLPETWLTTNQGLGWRNCPVPPGRVIRRHLLEKTAPGADRPARSSSRG